MKPLSTALRNPWLQLVLLVAAVSLAAQWWQARSERDIGSRVAAAAAPGELRMISSESCGICTLARGWFREHRVAFEECFVERDAACRAEFERLGAQGTPVIVVRGQPQLGFNPTRIARALGSAG
jgi:glutaredoxin